MNTAIELLGLGVLVPAAVALGMFWLLRQLLHPSAAGRYGQAVALGTAFFVGYALLPAWAPLLPERYWHWLPYLGLGAMVLGPVGLAEGIFTAERWLLYLLLAIIAACFLVPAWPDLQPSRTVLICVLAAWLFLLMALADALPDRLLGRHFPRLLVIIAGATAILITVSPSAKIGQVAGVSAAAMLGCCLLPLRGAEAVSSRGLVPAFAVIVGGLAFVGSIEPRPPNIGLLLAPGSILALWACAWGPLAPLRGTADIVAQYACVILPLVILCGAQFAFA